MSVARQSPLKWDDALFDARPFLKPGAPSPFYSSSLGALFGEDCMAVLPFIQDEVADTVFADPPFNLGKQYGSRSNDELTDSAYVVWCKEWIRESCRVLKPGGSFFLYNLT
jgi:site-specific DNA-methyltransferase (adenine-specific)